MERLKLSKAGFSLQLLLSFSGLFGAYLLAYPPTVFDLKKGVDQTSPYGFISSQEIGEAVTVFAVLLTSIGFLSAFSLLLPNKAIAILGYLRAFSRSKIFQKNKTFAAVILILLAFLVYLPCFGIGFHSDDYAWLRDSEISSRNIGHIFSLSQSHFFRPFTHLYHLTNYSLFKENPYPQHFSGIFLHGLNAFLLYLVVLRFKEDKRFGFLAALLFLTYPVSHRSIIWISGSEITFAAAFMVLSFYLFMSFLENGRRILYLSSASLFIAGLLAKEAVIGLAPALFIAGLWFGRGRLRWGGVLFLGLAAVFGIFQLCIQSGSFLLEKDIYQFRSAVMAKNLLGYAFASFIPMGYRIYYAVPQICQVVLAIAVLPLVFMLFKAPRFTSFFVSFYVFVLLPYLPFNLPVQPRYLYLPSFALCTVFAALLLYTYDNWLERSVNGRLAFHILLIFIVIANALLTSLGARRMKTQSDQMRLYIESVKNDERKWSEILQGKHLEGSPLSFDHLKAALKR